MDTYSSPARAADVRAYVDETYTEERQRAELEDSDTVVLIAHAAGEPAGFACLRFGTQPASGSFPYPAELARFYIDKRWHGEGIARRLMQAASAAARERGASTLWLAVWPANTRAVAFYRKEGFALAGAQPFRLGNEVQLDDVLARPLEETPGNG